MKFSPVTQTHLFLCTFKLHKNEGKNCPKSESRLNFDLRHPQLCALAKPAAKPRTHLKVWFTEDDQAPPAGETLLCSMKSQLDVAATLWPNS